MEQTPDYANQSRITFTAEQIRTEQASFMSKVYGWMFLALMLTGLTSLLVASNEAIVGLVVGNRLVFYGLIIGELALVWYLSARVASLSATAATSLFLFYAVVNGLTLSVIFLIYTMGSIASTFFVTAATFGAISAFGYFTKRDLTGMGSFLMMALVGLIIASVVNMFLQNSTFYWIVTYAGVLIFAGLTAYDTQKIKEMNVIGNEGTDEDRKEAVMGALTLYLDFINLFLLMLRIMGGRRD